MASADIELMAHLMRRAGFGATYEELEQFAADGYDTTVDELLSPMEQPDLEMDLLERYFIDWKEMNALEVNQAYLTYRMINTQRPLQEKMTLFWHGIFCGGNNDYRSAGSIPSIQS
ncbi:MAG: DUF1800 family protein [Dehalococcoidia bacterium]|nr:DUF1800 family protein [Dehalococcoidia bacterium]